MCFVLYDCPLVQVLILASFQANRAAQRAAQFVRQILWLILQQGELLFAQEN